MVKQFDRRVDTLELSVQSKEFLEGGNFNYIGQLVRLTEAAVWKEEEHTLLAEDLRQSLHETLDEILTEIKGALAEL